MILPRSVGGKSITALLLANNWPTSEHQYVANVNQAINLVYFIDILCTSDRPIVIISSHLSVLYMHYSSHRENAEMTIIIRASRILQRQLLEACYITTFPKSSHHLNKSCRTIPLEFCSMLSASLFLFLPILLCRIFSHRDGTILSRTTFSAHPHSVPRTISTRTMYSFMFSTFSR